MIRHQDVASDEPGAGGLPGLAQSDVIFRRRQPGATASRAYGHENNYGVRLVDADTMSWLFARIHPSSPIKLDCLRNGSDGASPSRNHGSDGASPSRNHGSDGASPSRNRRSNGSWSSEDKTIGPARSPQRTNLRSSRFKAFRSFARSHPIRFWQKERLPRHPGIMQAQLASPTSSRKHSIRSHAKPQRR
jgi:hypothetical protein